MNHDRFEFKFVMFITMITGHKVGPTQLLINGHDKKYHGIVSDLIMILGYNYYAWLGKSPQVLINRYNKRYHWILWI